VQLPPKNHIANTTSIIIHTVFPENKSLLLQQGLQQSIIQTPYSGSASAAGVIIT